MRTFELLIFDKDRKYEFEFENSNSPYFYLHIELILYPLVLKVPVLFRLKTQSQVLVPHAS